MSCWFRNGVDCVQFNLSHHIGHLSFGTDYPGQVNPLDGTEQFAEKGDGQFAVYIFATILYLIILPCSADVILIFFTQDNYVHLPMWMDVWQGTHASESGAIDRLHLSSASFWYMCHANLGLYSSGTRFRHRLEHCSVLSQKVACT